MGVHVASETCQENSVTEYSVVWVYSLSVLGTLGSMALIDLLNLRSSAAFQIESISQILVCFNGAAVSCTYAYFTWPVLGRNTHSQFSPESVRPETLAQDGNTTRLSLEQGTFTSVSTSFC